MTWTLLMKPELLKLADDDLKAETRRLNWERYQDVKKGDIVQFKTERLGKVLSRFVATEDARVEQLQDISVHAALSEGIRCPSCGYTLRDARFHMDHAICINRWLIDCKAGCTDEHPAIEAFYELWDSINTGPEKISAANPKVAVITFGRIDG